MDPDVKIELIKRSNNMEKIIETAKSDPDWHVRRFAVKYIRDDDVLKDIFSHDEVMAVSISAMEQISDVDFLADECLNNPFSNIRLATLNRICDESLLSDDDLNLLLKQVILNDPDDFISKVAVENRQLDNQEILIRIANSDRDESLRRAAISRIMDGGILINYALHDSNPLIRREAIANRNLYDHDVLKEIIKTDSDEFNRYLACEAIYDKDYFMNLLFDESFHPYLDALSKSSHLPSSDYFKGVYEQCDDEYRRQVAAYFIQDGQYLNNIVLNESNDNIRRDAIKNRHFTDQTLISDLLSKETDEDILCCLISKVAFDKGLISYIEDNMNDSKPTLLAISRLSDADFLAMLSESENPKIRRVVVESISHKKSSRLIFNTILEEMVFNETDKEICLELVKLIDDKYVIVGVAEKNEDRQIRLAALENIKTPKLLDNYLRHSNMESMEDTLFRMALDYIAMNESDSEIRHAAISKLNDKKALEQIISLDNVDSEIARKRLDTLFEDIKLIDRSELLKHLISSKDADVSYVAQKTLNDLGEWRNRISNVSAISDIDELKGIAQNDFNYYVRCEAEGRLERILFNIRLDEIGNSDNQEKLKAIVMDDSFTPAIRKAALAKINDETFIREYGEAFDEKHALLQS